MKVVLNSCYGGFGLSKAAVQWLKDHGYVHSRYSEHSEYDHDFHDIPRNHPLLVQCVEELGKAANGASADLEIEETEDGWAGGVREYDGIERLDHDGDYSVYYLSASDIVAEKLEGVLASKLGQTVDAALIAEILKSLK